MSTRRADAPGRPGGPRSRRGRRRTALAGLALLAALAAAASCGEKQTGQLMGQQPRYEPLEPSAFFPDGRSARDPVPGTVARGHLELDAHLVRGQAGPAGAGEAGGPATTFPFPVTAAVVARGRERFDVFCSPCHGRTGDGDGMVVRRGFLPPPTLHSEPMRRHPVGHFFQVITEGYGAMPSYARQIDPRDRWAIVAYVRALQLSQHARLSDVPEAERAALLGEAPR